MQDPVEILANMSTNQLEGVRAVLVNNADALAPVALRIVDTQLWIRHRATRARGGYKWTS
jgi:hypothetical protein